MKEDHAGDKIAYSEQISNRGRAYQDRILDNDNRKEGITSTEYGVENHGKVTVITKDEQQRLTLHR